MSTSVLIRSSDGSWRPPSTTAYAGEDHLQRVIADQPDLLPSVGPGAVCVREFTTTAGPIDVCVVEPNGDLTVVECKLASNSEQRRMVIGQVIDYASAIWRDGFADFRATWDRHAHRRLDDLLDATGLRAIEENVRRPRIHLCLAVDLNDDDLERLVEFVNAASSPDISVTAIQLSYAANEGTEMLIPITYGGELVGAKTRAEVRGTNAWTVETFLETATGAVGAAAARQLLERCEALPQVDEHGPLWFGNAPGGSVFLHPHGLRYAPISLAINSAGEIMVYGLWAQYPTNQRRAAYEAIAEMLGQSIDGGMRGVALASLDLDQLWSEAVRCADRVHDLSPMPSTS